MISMDYEVTRSPLILGEILMIKPINHDQTSLQQQSIPAGPQDQQVAQDLLDTLKAHHDKCVGMAANMIGVHKRIIAVNIGPTDLLMLNPVITRKNSPYQAQEGCLSLPGERSTTRYQQIIVRFSDVDGHQHTLPLTGFAAQIVQHEVDHCNGILI